MNQSVVIVQDPADIQLWQHYVDTNPHSKIYHRWEWIDIVRQVFGRDAYYFMVKDNEQVTGVLPLVHFNSPLFGNFLISYPFVNYGGILAEDDGSYHLLLQAAREKAIELRAEFVELRYDREMPFDLPVKTHKVTFLLDLPDDEEVLWKSFK